MKYVILIHSNPTPWGHTSDFVPEFQDLPEDIRARQMKDFEEVLVEMQADGGRSRRPRCRPGMHRPQMMPLPAATATTATTTRSGCCSCAAIPR